MRPDAASICLANKRDSGLPVANKFARVLRSFAKATKIARVATVATVAIASGCSILGLPGLACNCDQVKVPSPAPENFSCAAGEKFYNSPEYTKEFVRAIADAKAFCIKFKSQHAKEKLAVVCDIDETLLNNEPMLRGHDKIDSDTFWVTINTSTVPKLKRTADLLAWARKNSFSIFLVTGRHEKYRAHTIVNLREQDISYDGLYMRPDDQSGAAENYKTDVRKSIEKMGFTIAENIGDQFSDLVGGHSADCTKLPNQFYFIP